MNTLLEAVEDFLQANQAVWSPHTAHAYRTALTRFLHYLDSEEDIRPDAPAARLAEDLELPLRYADYLANAAVPVSAGTPAEGAPKPGRGLSELTYQLYLTALGRWYAHLFMVEALGDVSAAGFQRLETRLATLRHVSLKSTQLRPERERSAPPDEVIDRLLRVARAEMAPPEAEERERRLAELRRLRNVALLETLRSTGARISEALGLNTGDLRPGERSAVIRREVGKGDKRRLIFFDGRAWFALQVYLAESDRGGASNTPLFLRHDRGAGRQPKRLNPGGAQAELRRLRGLLVRDIQAELARLLLPEADGPALQRQVDAFAEASDTTGDLPAALYAAQQAHPERADEIYLLKLEMRQAQELTAHSFRHALASRILERTGDLAATQDILGHADPRTTRRYAELSGERLREIHRQAMEPSQN